MVFWLHFVGTIRQILKEKAGIYFSNCMFLRKLLVKSVKLQTKTKKKRRIPVRISVYYVSLHE